MDTEDKMMSMNNSIIFLGFVKKEIMGLAIFINSDMRTDLRGILGPEFFK